MTLHDKHKSHQIIESFEARELERRPLTIRIADWLTSGFGSIAFLLLNLAFFAFWILVNTGNVSGIPIFDPFPFILLTMIVSLEAIALTVIVLMSQNRQAEITTLREELDMQVNLMAEREITKVLDLQKLIMNKLGIKLKDSELEDMTKETDISYIETQLAEQIKISKKAKRI